MTDSAGTILSSIENSGWKKNDHIEKEFENLEQKDKLNFRRLQKKRRKKVFLFRVSFLKTKKAVAFLLSRSLAMARYKTVWASTLVINGLVLLGCGFTSSASADNSLAASAAPKGERGFST